MKKLKVDKVGDRIYPMTVLSLLERHMYLLSNKELIQIRDFADKCFKSNVDAEEVAKNARAIAIAEVAKKAKAKFEKSKRNF